MNLDVVVIDDDAVVLFLHKILIKKSALPSKVADFIDAETALKFVEERSRDNKLLLFLDINMPKLTGWDFLDKLNNITYSENVFVVMVTSSINSSDRELAKHYDRVIDYREKPLSKQACEEIYFKITSLL